MKYGSDPLLTYLPDSDIDITIIVNNHFKSKSKDESVFMSPLDQLKMLKNFLIRFQKVVDEMEGDMSLDCEQDDEHQPPA